MNFEELIKKTEVAFNNYIEEIERGRLNDAAIRRAGKKYDVKNLKINNITPLRAKKIYSSILPKYEYGVSTDRSWLQNQRRLFIWCAICYLHKNSLEISELVHFEIPQKDEDYQYMKTMFPFKDIDLLKFQIFGLIKKDPKNSTWTEEEDQILKKIILEKNESGELEWSNIAKEFFIATEEKYFRNAKQCRERWLNHLDPNKSKGKWLLEQDIVLLKQVLKRGKKWSQIVIALEKKKNEHMVKNRYKSLIHKKEKETRNKKIKENDLIMMILRDLENQEGGAKQEEESHQNRQISEEAEENQSDAYGKTRNSRKKESDMKKAKKFSYAQSMEDQEEFDEQLQDEEFYQEEAEYKMEQVPQGLGAEKQLQNFRKDNPTSKTPQTVSSGGSNSFNPNKNKNWPIIVEPNNKKPGVSASPLPFADPPAMKNDEEDQIQQDYRNQVQIYGNKNETDMFQKIFQNAGTPNPLDNNNNRFPPLFLESRSPAASLFMSPYPPAGWTPTIFYMDGTQGEASPQVSFGNFCSKFKSDFHKFLGEEEEKPGQNK